MIMKKTTILLTLLIAIIGLDSCSDNDTYADKLKREGVAINSFITKHGINVISEEQFASQDSTTDITKNQFVYFTNTGVYLQIMNKGCGTKIKKGEITTVLCRFTERNLLSDTIQLTNNSVYTSGIVDKMIVANTSGSFTASFYRNSSMMVRRYKTTAVPAGWLVPLPYVNIGRQKTESDSLAHVRIIVPSAQGQASASRNTYPCYYDITYQRGL